MDRIYYDSQAIGKRIRDIRKKHGYTQAKLAEELMVTNYSVLNFEKGKTACMPEHIMIMCQLFNVTADYFYFGIDRKLNNNNIDLDIISILQNCSTENKEKIKEIIKILINNT